MLAEIEDSPCAGNDKLLDTTPVPVTVIVVVADPPTEQPAFAYEGLTTARSIWVYDKEADFTLTLSPRKLPPDFAMTFAPLSTDGLGPIIWRYPGTKDPRERPGYISEPVLSDPMTLQFTVTNTAVPDKDTLVSFTLRVLLTGPGLPEEGITFESPDPTIINVDPPPPLPPAF